MTARRAGRALAAVALAAAAFGSGFLSGRRGAPQTPAPDFLGREIREGRRGYLNPLLECEVDTSLSELEPRPFGKELATLIERLEKDPEVATIAAYYRDLDSGFWIGRREREGFVPASLGKVPIVLACLRQAASDPFFLAHSIVYRRVEPELEPVLQNAEVSLEPGKSYTVEELIRRVAVYSDNAAAMLLASAVAPAVLDAVYHDLGLPERGPGGEDGRMSPKQYGALFRVLYNASYLDRRHSVFVLDQLAHSTFELGLVAGVLGNVVVSHKFGVWKTPDVAVGLQLHDCGIVYHPARPYLLCVMTSGGNFVKMSAAISEVSRFVYRRVEESSPWDLRSSP